jgi:hypothetical protein
LDSLLRWEAQRIANFMKGMFKVSDPSEAPGNSITAREILDNGSKDGNAGSSLAVIWFQRGSIREPTLVSPMSLDGV